MLPFRTLKSVEELGVVFDQILNVSGASSGDIAKKKTTCSVLLIQASKEVMEAIGHIRYRRAEILSKVIVNSENNLQLRDPEEHQQQEQFQAANPRVRVVYR